MRPLAPLLLLLALPSCAPSFASLVADRRYADAACKARSRAEAEALVAEVERAAELRLHLHTVREEELAAALGDKGKEIAQKATFVRTRATMNKLPIAARPGTEIRLDGGQRARELGGQGHPSAEQAIALFALTAERPPAPHKAVDSQALAREIGWGFLTAGLKQLLFGTGQLTHTVDPGRDDYLRNGPAAMALFDGLNSPAGVEAFLLPTRLESAELEISLDARETDEDLRSCDLTMRYRIPLTDPGKPLWQSTERTFGPRAPLITELKARRSFSLHNPQGSWSSP